MIQTFGTKEQALAHLATVDKTRWPEALVCHILNPIRRGGDEFLIRLTAREVLGCTGVAESNDQYFLL